MTYEGKVGELVLPRISCSSLPYMLHYYPFHSFDFITLISGNEINYKGLPPDSRMTVNDKSRRWLWHILRHDYSICLLTLKETSVKLHGLWSGSYVKGRA
jgi:hypothetical protein